MILGLEMGMKRSTVQVEALALRASVAPKTIDEEKRTVEVVWTTGARVLRGYFNQFWEELSLDPKHVNMERLNGGAPLLDSHNGYDNSGVIGVVESARLEKGKGTATVRFAKAEDDPNADSIFRKVKDGIIRNVSVGYRVHKMEQIEEEGKIPVFRAVSWTPHEISFVPVGADAGAGARGEQVMKTPCEFEERSMDPDSPAPTTTPAPATTSAPATQPAAAIVAVAAPAQRSEAEIKAGESARVLGIQRVGRTLNRPDAEVNDAIAKGTSLEAFRAAAVDAIAVTPPKGDGSDGRTIVFGRGTDPVIAAGEDSRDKWLRGAGNWLIERSGVAGVVNAAAKARGETVDLDPGEFRGERMIDLARMCLERSGVKTKGMLARDLVGQAFTRSGGHAATGDFPILLENVLHKVMLAMYAVTPDKWSRFCSRGSVSDFKPHKRYRVGSFGALSALNEHGEFTNKAIPDGERQTQQAGTKGNIIGITRQAIINDDLSAFSTLATALGRAARLSIEVDVFALLALNAGLGPTMADGKALFHLDHGNIGTAAALTAAALDVDRQFMGLQRDPSGNELLELRPSILLVPVSLGGQARVINDSAYDPDTVANKAQMKANIAGKMFDDIVDTGRITGTRRYLFADPNIAPVIEVAFLDGQDLPFMEMKEGFRLDGIEWRARLDYGVAALDHRGAVTNAGAP